MFHGSIVALVTPMSVDGSIDYPALDKLLEFHVEQGTDAIVAVGTTGESATLNHTEHCSVVRHCVAAVDGRIPVIAGTGSNSTDEAIQLSRCAMEAGADASLLVTPYYNKPTQEGLFQHYARIADQVPMPHILYNVPGRTACDMLPETVERLAGIPNIVGIKEASGTVERMVDIIGRCGDALDVFSGDDGIARQAMLSGAKGVISVTANVAPRLMHEMCAAALAGDADTAAGIDARLAGLHSGLFVQSNPIPVKWAVAELGLIESAIRLPLTWLTDDAIPVVRQAMADAGVR